jgi:Domain of unknown function (DUF1816)
MRRQFWKDSESEAVFAAYLEKMGIAWWIEVITNQPRCIYYFGPFSSSYDAQASSNGYLEDLEQEKAQIINVDIKRGKPKQLTIFEDEFEENLTGRLQPVIPNFAEAWLG